MRAVVIDELGDSGGSGIYAYVNSAVCLFIRISMRINAIP